MGSLASRLRLVVVPFLVAAVAWMCLVQAGITGEPSKTKVVIVAGPCEHPPGTHEGPAGARLLKYCVEHAEKVPSAAAEVIHEWPNDDRALDDAATIVFTGDIFPPQRMPDPTRIKTSLARQMDRGCGIVCVHYATGLRGVDVAPDGDHPLLRWMGGYFATGGCTHHKSVARVCTATISPENNQHPILRGWREFTFDDEPYWNNYFGQGGMPRHVTPLAYSMLPADQPKKEIVAWAVDRQDGGRGVGIVIPHYFRNWRLDDVRTLVLNSVFWTAKCEVPLSGVRSSLPDLATFKPTSVDPQPRPKEKAEEKR